MADALLLPFGSPWPQALNSANSGWAMTTHDLGTQNAKVGTTFTCPVTGTITQVGIRIGVTTGTPAAGSYRIGLQGISTTTGNPDGTYLSSGNAFVDFTPAAAPSADDGTFKWYTLGSSYSATIGDRIAVVVERTAATDASNKITATTGVETGGRRGFPVSQTHNGTSWTKSGTILPVYGIATASKAYGMPLSSSSGADDVGGTLEKGIKFNIPTQFCSTFKLGAVRVAIKTANTGAKDFYATLYSAPGGTPVIQAQTNIIDGDFFSAVGSSNRFCDFVFTSQPTLNAGTDYVIAIATTTAADSAVYSWSVTTDTDWDAWAGGRQFAYAARTLNSFPPSGDDSASFTYTSTKRPLMEVVFEDITAPAGGGTTIAGTPMRRGMV